MVIISLHYIKPVEDVEKHLQAHIAFLEKYYAAGIFICSGRKIPRTGGLIIAKGASREQIEAIIREDPFHSNGIADYELTEFTPSKYSPQFEAVLE